MLKRVLQFLFLILVGLGSNLSATEDSPEDRELLRQYRVVAQGGYEGRIIWGRMVAVIPAPPQLVWELFVNSNDWNQYGIPRLTDSRIVSEELAVQDLNKVEDFYRALGDQSFLLSSFRRAGERWTHFAFQYYNIIWPVSNRWMVVKTSDDETRSAERIYKANWARAAGNVTTVDGYLLLEPFEGNSRLTRMEYGVKTDPGTHVPRFMVKWGVKKMMPAVINAIRREAAQRMSQPTIKKAPN